jgi:hypothetical protein
MANFNMNDYVSVAERLNQASDKISMIITEPPVMLTDAMGFTRATVSLTDGRSATGMASFRLDLQGRGAQATFPLEDAETSAIGRALAFLGYSSSKSIASREEMQEAEKRQAAPTNGTDRRQKMITKIQTLMVDARERNIEVKHKPLDAATDDELVTIGKAYTAALEKRGKINEEVDIPV